MRKQTPLFLLVLFICFCFKQPLQAFPNPTFHHWTEVEGLSSNSVTSLAKDSLGVLWLGTRYGLNSFDGYHLRTFTSTSGNMNSLIENQIRSLQCDQMTLYIQTVNYITVYEIKADKYTHIAVSNASSFDQNDSLLFVATANGVKTLDKFTHELQDLLPHIGIATMVRLQGESLLIGTEDAFYRYHLGTGVLEILRSGINVMNIYIDQLGDYWISTREQGVYIFRDQKLIDHITTPQLASNFVRDIVQDAQGNYYIGSLRGLDMLDRNRKPTSQFTAQQNNPASLSHSSIWSLLYDSNEVLWIGTYFGGLNAMSTKKDQPQYFFVEGERDLSYNIMGSMAEDSQDNLYIGTHGGGLNRLDAQTGVLSNISYRSLDQNSVGSNNIQDLHNHKDSLLLIATNTDRLNVMDMNTMHFKSYNNHPDFKKCIQSGVIHDIEPYGRNYLLATQHGVYVFNVESETLVPLFQEKERMIESVTCTKVDRSGNIWIGYEFGGLDCYNPNFAHLKSFDFELGSHYSLSSNEVRSIHEDTKGRIWITTPSGLNLFRSKTQDFITFNKEDGLSSSQVYRVVDSRYKDILVATNKGLDLLTMDGDTLLDVKNMNVSPLNMISSNSMYYSSRGDIWLGGHNGILSLNERSFLGQDHSTSQVQVTSISVGDHYLSPASTPEALPHQVAFCKEITLDYQQNFLSFQFSNLAYDAINTYDFEYQLEPFDASYLPADQTNQVAYNNLSPGSYRFKVRSLKEGRVLAEQGLDVMICPPFYRSNWAIMFYVLIILLAIGYILRLYYLHMLTKRDLLVEQREHQREKEYAESKLKFFANISHELRTPLALISGQLEQVMDSDLQQSVLYTKLSKVYKNATKLQELADELLDTHKRQSGLDAINPTALGMNEFVHEVYMNYLELAQSKHLEFTFDNCVDEVLFAHCDPQAMERILYNLLSNAFKFTYEGSIRLKLYGDDTWVRIDIQDTGIGIEPEELPKIFDRYYRSTSVVKENNVAGFGIGLELVHNLVKAHHGEIRVTSELNQGSCFTVEIPRCPAPECEQKAPQQDNSLIKDLLLDKDMPIDEVITTLKEKRTRRDDLILVVEDNKEMQEFLVDSLSPFYHVEAADDGQIALQRIQKLKPVLIISDVMMPNMSGTEMCRQVKSNPETCCIPVILLTDRNALTDQIEGLHVGADEYLNKPFSFKYLLARIDNILSNRKLLVHNYSKESSIVSDHFSIENDADQEFISKAFAIIVEQVSNDKYSVDQFAGDMFMGRTNFFKKLKSITNMTPNEFILSIRLKHASELLLKRKEMTVDMVADGCGFNSQQYFSNCFKRKYGMTPIQYRNQKITHTINHTNHEN